MAVYEQLTLESRAGGERLGVGRGRCLPTESIGVRTERRARAQGVRGACLSAAGRPRGPPSLDGEAARGPPGFFRELPFPGLFSPDS